MPRKKLNKEGFHTKFIPTGRLKDLETLADANEGFADKKLALLKYIEVFSNLVERCWNSNKTQQPISQRILSKKLGVESAKASKLIKDLLTNNFLKIDKSTFKLGEAAWSYIPVYQKLDCINIQRKVINNKSDLMLNDFNVENLSEDCKKYFNVLKKLCFDNDMIKDIVNNINYNTTLLTNPKGIYCNSSVPYDENGIGECNSSVPYQNIPTELVPIIKIINKQFRISRPIPESRVYTNITNLSRDYRKYLRLNGKPLIGFDIANSQPLIGAIAFRRYSVNNYGCIKPDVLDYQQACEAGRFYEYFMELNGINIDCEEARTNFKAEFFGKVFYTKEVEKENLLKLQFKTKYPTCYEAIFQIKGGLYSKKYKDFPAIMTEIETAIMFETNLELIDMGYDVVNIFDSLYSDSEEAIGAGKKLVTEKFEMFGITPTLKAISYTNQIKKPALKTIEIINEVKHTQMENKPKVAKPIKAQDIEHTLSDGYKIYRIEYFINQYKIDIYAARDLYRSQYFVDASMAKNRNEFNVLTNRKHEIEKLIEKENIILL